MAEWTRSAEAPERGDSLGLRVLSAAIFLPFLIYLSWYGGLPFLGLVALMVGLGLLEFYEMLRAKGERPYVATGIACGLLMVWAAHLVHGIHANFLLTAVLLGLMAVELFRKDNRGALHNISGTVFGVLYVAWLGSHLVLLRDLPEILEWTTVHSGLPGASVIFYLFACAWGSDTGAYFIGRALGKRPLLARVSPNKSVEGAVGGLVAGAGMGWLASASFASFLPPPVGALLGLCISFTGQVGDMVESLLKRDTERKDSAVSMIIPGHGGVLDRFDSSLFAAPLLYYALKAIYL